MPERQTRVALLPTVVSASFRSGLSGESALIRGLDLIQNRAGGYNQDMDANQSNFIRRGLILALFALAGGVVWGYFCQRTLSTGKWSLRGLLGLVLAIAVAIQLGLLFLAIPQTID